MLASDTDTECGFAGESACRKLQGTTYRGVYAGFYLSVRVGERTVAGRGGVRHNGDGEKDSETNQVERDVSEVTEGGPTEVHPPVRRSDVFYGTEEGGPSDGAGRNV